MHSSPVPWIVRAKQLVNKHRELAPTETPSCYEEGTRELVKIAMAYLADQEDCPATFRSLVVDDDWYQDGCDRGDIVSILTSSITGVWNETHDRAWAELKRLAETKSAP